jgi:hypothetical protein
MKYNINVIEPSHAGRDWLGKHPNRTARWSANPPDDQLCYVRGG